MSEIWKYFVKEGNIAKCKICKIPMKYQGGSTSSLWRHKSFHLSQGLSENSISDDGNPHPQTPMEKYLNNL